MKNPSIVNIEELFSKDNYVIPIYQRNFAWGNREITQLIQDIVDYIKKDREPIDEKPNYYIGSLIVYERRNNIFETIDGQQRLTTLIILLSVIKNEYKNVNKNIENKISWFKELNLKFDSRRISTETLEYLFKEGEISNQKCNSSIKQGYEDAKNALKKILADFDLPIETFCKYLFKKVKVLRVSVPPDTDLNHYFEIMNNRGEQLEKHEILKAKCLEILDEKDRYTFNLIWEACSNMENYVQYEFKDQRDALFGQDISNKWNVLISYDDLYNLETPSKEGNQPNNNDEKYCIKKLIGSKQFSEQSEQNGETAERFNSVINFSNFLLHILRIQKEEDIALDDKRLIELFDSCLPKEKNEKKEFVKLFGYNLLKGKYLFDKYIIKREFTKGTDQWSLKLLKSYDNNTNFVNTFGSGGQHDGNNSQDISSQKNDFESEDNNEGVNREIIMLQSMFHVSNPTLVYKHWLNAALKFVFKSENVTAKTYKKFLEDLAKAFLFDRFLAKQPKDYFEIIYTNNGLSKNTTMDIDWEELNQGTSVENFIFNYLDYLLWQNYKTDEKKFFIVEDKTIKDSKISDFEYTFRSSIEHYYPQHPIEGNPKIDDIWLLNHFGNLCLISTSKNSRLSNYMPNAKKDHYNRNATIDSIKQRIMMEYESWDISGNNNQNEIEEHGEIMKKLLVSKLEQTEKN